ncbi:unnamed protein product [Urochloa humidicola]
MRPPALYLPFYAFFFFLITCSLVAAAGGVDPGRQGDNHHNITGGEAVVVVTSTALVPFALFPGAVHLSRGHGGHLGMVAVAPPPSPPVSGACLCLTCLPSRHVCFLMAVGSFLLATPRPLDCSTSRRSPWAPTSSNASSSAAALLHKLGAGAHNTVCDEVPSCSLYGHPSNASWLLAMGSGINKRRRSRNKVYRTGPWNGNGWHMEESQVTITSAPAADVKVTFGYVFWMKQQASFSLVATTGEDGELQQRVAWGPPGPESGTPAMNSSSSSPAGCAAFGLTGGALCICLTASRPSPSLTTRRPPSRRVSSACPPRWRTTTTALACGLSSGAGGGASPIRAAWPSLPCGGARTPGALLGRRRPINFAKSHGCF